MPPTTFAPATSEELAAAPLDVTAVIAERNKTLVDRTEETEERLLGEAVGKARAARRAREPKPSDLVRKRRDRWYADFTSPLTGKRVRDALKPEGHSLATTSVREANRLAEALYREHLELAGKREMGVDVRADLSAAKFVEAYLDWMLTRPLGAAHIRQTAVNLRRLLEQTRFGKVQDIRKVGPPFLADVIADLKELTYTHPVLKGKSGPFSPNMVRQHMSALSGLFTYAMYRGHMVGNPAKGHKDTPSAPPPDGSKFLEMDEMARLLAAARHRRRHYANPYIYEILMVLAYTGARVSEVMRMGPNQIDFEANTITVKGSKNEHSFERTFRMWAPLRECMLAFFAEFRPTGPLLFPAVPVLRGRRGRAKARPNADNETLLRRGLFYTLGRIARQAGIDKEEVTHHYLRHTYVTARLSMMVRNPMGELAPVPHEQVRREIGHSPKGTAHTMERVYSHTLTRAKVAMDELDYDLFAHSAKP